jgi:hypothetical protein
MLKNDTGVLRLGVYNILKKMNNTSVTINQNMLAYSKSNLLGNYYIATFTYNLRPRGAKKESRRAVDIIVLGMFSIFLVKARGNTGLYFWRFLPFAFTLLVTGYKSFAWLKPIIDFLTSQDTNQK